MSSEPRRLHPAAMIIGAAQAIRRSVSAFVVPGVAFVASQGFSMRTLAFVILGAILVAVAAAFWGFLSWRATTYEVSAGAFRLRQGVLQKNERTIPLGHVQSVDTVQGVVQRLFGVVEVRVETAGGGSAEPDASLSALDRPSAESLRRELEGSPEEMTEKSTAASPTVLRRLGTRELLLAGATSGQIGVALSLVAVVSQFLDNLLSESFAQRLAEVLTPRSVVSLAGLLVVIAFLSWLLAIGGTILAHAGFTLSRDGEFLYIRRGLLERREATIPLARIQAIRIVEGILRQPFGLVALRVESAGYGDSSGVSTVLFPLLPRTEAQRLLSSAAPEFAVAPALSSLPARALRRYVFRATVPALLATAAALVSVIVSGFFAWGLLVPLVVPLAAAYGWLRYRDAGWARQGDSLVVRFRHLARTTFITPRRRLQSREVIRSPFQRRARLATFRVLVASGGGGAAVQVTDLDSSRAEALAEGLGPAARKGGAEPPGAV